MTTSRPQWFARPSLLKDQALGMASRLLSSLVTQLPVLPRLPAPEVP